MTMHTKPTISVPQDLLEALLEYGTFRGIIDDPAEVDRAVPYIIAVAEATKILEDNAP